MQSTQKEVEHERGKFSLLSNMSIFLITLITTCTSSLFFKNLLASLFASLLTIGVFYIVQKLAKNNKEKIVITLKQKIDFIANLNAYLTKYIKLREYIIIFRECENKIQKHKSNDSLEVLNKILTQAQMELNDDMRIVVSLQKHKQIDTSKYEKYVQKLKELQYLLDFYNLSWKDKKVWVLKNGYMSWLFEDQQVKNCFKYFDDIENINTLHHGKLSADEGVLVNKLLKLFPNNEEQTDRFFSYIEKNMVKSEVFNLINECTLNREFNTGKTKIQKLLNEKDLNDQKIKKAIEEFTAIANKLKKG